MNKEYLNQKVLLTTASWFYAPDGRQYKGVWGTLKAVQEVKEKLGFVPNRSHANWFYEIGDMVIMGCQVQVCIQTDQRPPDIGKGWDVKDGVVMNFETPSPIYITD